MDSHRQIVLLEACLGHLYELAGIHKVGVGHARSIEQDIRRVQQCLKDLRAATAGGEPAEDRDRWVDDIIAAYESLGGISGHKALYDRVRRIRQSAGRSLPPHFKSLVRQTLQAHCSGSRQYRGQPDLFVCLSPGQWALKSGANQPPVRALPQ